MKSVAANLVTNIFISPRLLDEHKISEIVERVRDLLEMKKDDKIDKPWFTAPGNIPIMLRLFVFVLKELDEQNPEFVKGMNLLPICSIKPHFITIDTYSLYGIMKEANMIGCNEATFVDLKDEQ